MLLFIFFFFQAEDGIRDYKVTGVQTCALPISRGDGLQRALRKDAVLSLLALGHPGMAHDDPRQGEGGCGVRRAARGERTPLLVSTSCMTSRRQSGGPWTARSAPCCGSATSRWDSRPPS